MTPVYDKFPVLSQLCHPCCLAHGRKLKTVIFVIFEEINKPHFRHFGGFFDENNHFSVQKLLLSDTKESPKVHQMVTKVHQMGHSGHQMGHSGHQMVRLVHQMVRLVHQMVRLVHRILRNSQKFLENR